MSTDDLMVDDISAEFEVSKALVRMILRRYKEYMRSYLVDGTTVKISGVGSLKVVDRKQRKNILNGKEYDSSKRSVKFSPSVKFKILINE